MKETVDILLGTEKNTRPPVTRECKKPNVDILRLETETTVYCKRDTDTEV